MNGHAEVRGEQKIGRDTKLLIRVKPEGDSTYISIKFEIMFNKHALLLKFERNNFQHFKCH